MDLWTIEKFSPAMQIIFNCNCSSLILANEVNRFFFYLFYQMMNIFKCNFLVAQKKVSISPPVVAFTYVLYYILGTRFENLF